MATKLTTGAITDAKDCVKQEIITNFSHVAVGDDDTAASASDTALGNELHRNSRQEYSETSEAVFISGFFRAAEANGNTLRELGFFDAASGGNLKMRSVLDTPITKNSSKEVWFDGEVGVEVTQS